MKLAIAQLGDIHLASQHDPILQRVSFLCNAIAAELDNDTKTLLLLFTGDFVQSGAAEEFALALQFIHNVTKQLHDCTNLDPVVLCIPGNHDLDLSDDQDARNTLVAMHRSNEIPAGSTTEIILAPLQNYFAFASDIATAAPQTKHEPFVTTHSVMVGTQRVTFRLLNSAWISTRAEKTNSLYFPVKLIDANAGQLDEYVVSVLHHPINWFKQPETMRSLQTKLESCSDLVFTGHEHGHDHYAKQRAAGLNSVTYLEGGVLQERGQDAVSSFSVLCLDFSANAARFVRL